MAQHRQPDHSRGDANTLGGYMAVHERPAAFEGSDGFSYSVEIVADETGDPGKPWGAYLLFVQWARIGASSPIGHLETDFLHRARRAESAVGPLESMPLSEVRELLDQLIRARHGGEPPRKWWDAMRAEDQG
jgi:hypothetical protein